MSVSGLFTKIYRDIVNDQVEMVRLPDVVMRLRKTMADENVSIDILARVIQTDVGASAYILGIANSPAYRTQIKSTDIAAAIRVIGIAAIANLLTAYAVRSLIDGKQFAALNYARQNWQRSAHRAAIACAIAKSTPGVDADRALLAGLLQDVGVLPILMKLRTEDLAELDDNTIDHAVDSYAGKVGVVLSEHWGLDPDFTAVIRHRGALAYDGGARTDLVDVVNIARLLSQIGGGERSWPRLEDAPCLQKYAEGGLTLQHSLELLKAAQDDINAVRQVLAG